MKDSGFPPNTPPQGFIKKRKNPNDNTQCYRYYRTRVNTYGRSIAVVPQITEEVPTVGIGAMIGVTFAGEKVTLRRENWAYPLVEGVAAWYSTAVCSGRDLNDLGHPTLFYNDSRKIFRNIEYWLYGNMCQALIIEGSNDKAHWVVVDILQPEEMTKEVGRGLMPKHYVRDLDGTRRHTPHKPDILNSRFWRVVVESTCYLSSTRELDVALYYVDLVTAAEYSMKSSATLTTPHRHYANQNTWASALQNGGSLQLYPTGIAVDFYSATPKVPVTFKVYLDYANKPPLGFRVMHSEDGIKWATYREVELERKPAAQGVSLVTVDIQ